MSSTIGGAPGIISDEVPKALQEFANLVDTWSKFGAPPVRGLKDPRAAFLSCQSLLHSFIGGTLNKQKMNKMTPIVCVVGDQSSGKTAICNRLLNCCCMRMATGTATKARTMVDYGWSKTHEESCAMKYKTTEEEEMTLDQLWNLHESTFEEEKINHDNLCKISIQSADSSYSLAIMDHPGFTSSESDVTTECFEKTLHENKGNPFASLLFVASAEAAKRCRAGDGSYVPALRPSRKPLKDLGDKHNLFMAITHADKLDFKTLFGDDTTLRTCFPPGKLSEGKVIVTGLDIARFVKSSFTTTEAGEEILPSSVEAFFVCGYSKSKEDLLRTDRWSVFNKNAEDNDAKLFGIFTDRGLWETSGNLELADMSSEEAETLKKMLGFGRLRSRLLQSQQTAHMAQQATLFPLQQETIRDKVNSAKNELKKYTDDLHSFQNLSSSACDFLQTFNELYCNTAGPSEVWTPDQMGTDPKTRERWLKLKEVWSSFGEKGRAGKVGWKLEDEENMFGELRGSDEAWLCFPPVHHRVEDGGVDDGTYFKQWLKDLNLDIHNSDKKLHTLSTLMHRFRTEFAIRSQAIKIKDVDEDALLAKAKQSVQTTLVDLKETVAAHVGDLLARIYGEGNPFVAKRTAMACMQHAQTVLTAMSQLHEFNVFFPVKGANMLEGTTVLKNHSRHLNWHYHAHSCSQEKLVQAAKMNLETDLLSDLRRTVDSDREYSGAHAITDLMQVIVAHCFDSVYDEMFGSLEAHTRKLLLSLPVFFPSTLHLGPVFMHQDQKFLQKYLAHFPTHPLPTNISAEARLGVDEKINDSVALKEAQEDAQNRISNLKLKTVVDILGMESGDKVLLDLALQNLENLDEKGKAHKVSELMNQNCGPDVVAPICATSKLREFEVESINFVIKRYMTSAIKKTTDEILLNCTSIVYKFMHPVALARNRDDLNERYMSLLMGYPYPYTIREQPRHLRHLSLDVVIPFLKRHITQLKAYGYARKNKIEGLPEGVTKEFWATTQELGMNESKLVQGIFALLTNSELGNFFLNNRGSNDGSTCTLQLAVSFVDVWYMKWLEGLKGDHMSASLAEDIRTFLLEIRYWKADGAKNDLRMQMTCLRDLVSQWEKVQVALNSFHDFAKLSLLPLDGELTHEQRELRPKKLDFDEAPPDDIRRLCRRGKKGYDDDEPREFEDNNEPPGSIRTMASKCSLLLGLQCKKRKGCRRATMHGWATLCEMLFQCPRHSVSVS